MAKDFTEHKYIQILKYAYENKVFTKSQMVEAIDITDNDFAQYVNDNIAKSDENSNQGLKSYDKNIKWTMSYEAFINYLEYIELKESRADSKQARAEAKQATRWAIAAMVVSATLAITSIGLSLCQL